jgi:hypothetical protein
VTADPRASLDDFLVAVVDACPPWQRRNMQKRSGRRWLGKIQGKKEKKGQHESCYSWAKKERDGIWF